MKIPPTKHDVPPTKYDVPLLFTQMKGTGQHIISCKDLSFLTGLHAKRQDHPLTKTVYTQQ